MRVAHFSVFKPNQCGLYHTAKELVLAEQSVGIDAGFIAYEEKDVCVDGDFKTKPLEWADDADVLVRHSAIPDRYHNSGKPIILALHGRPESSMLLDSDKTTEVIQMLFNKQTDCRYKAYVTFWEEYVDIWKNIVNRPLFYAPSIVDFNEYKPDNPKHKLGDGYHILICDMWREDVRPFNVLFAAQKFALKHENVKIHLVGLSKEYTKSMAPFLVNMREQGILGHVSGQIKEIKSFYSACDMVLSSHVIATRSIREALASGCKLVAGAGCKYTPYTANPMDIDGYADAIERCYESEVDFLQIAKDNFSMQATGNAMKAVFESVMPKKSEQRKVFIDIGGHLGETVRRFFREVDDAAEYEIYSFEPDPKTFEALDKSVGHIKNVDLINACVSDTDGIKDFYVGRMNNNEGGTLLKGKFTGGVDYKKPEKVESINLVRWLKSNINEGDKVILKMNIEGGEYDLMELLLDNDLTGLFDKIHIQLHSHKFTHGDDRFRFNKIEERFYNESKCRNLFLTNKGVHSFAK